MPSSLNSDDKDEGNSMSKNKPPTIKSQLVSNAQTFSDERMETYDFPHVADDANENLDLDDQRPQIEVERMACGVYKPSRSSHRPSKQSSGNFSMQGQDESP